MSYFNHAFKKAFVAGSVLDADNTKTKALTQGQLALVHEADWESIDSGTSLTNAKGLLYIVQGSLMTQDKIGNNPGHGGYKESVKSKGINPKFIHRIWSVEAADPTQSTSTISVGSTCAPCGENLFLRLDVKGSPALRFLNHNAYAIGDSSGDPVANGGTSIPSLCCADGQEYLDPALALAAAAQMVIADPIISPFVAEGSSGNVATLTVSVGGTGYTASGPSGVSVTGGSGSGLKVVTTVVANAVTAAVILADTGGKGYKVGDIVTVDGGNNDAKLAVATVAAGGVVVETTAVPFKSLTLAQVLDGSTYTASTDPVADGVSASVTFVGAYVSTQFGNCSFDTRDHYRKEPVQIIASLLDESGDPCSTCGTTTNVPGVMGQTLGEKVLRDVLCHENYRQSPYHQGSKDSARLNEIEHFDDIKEFVKKDELYKAYYVQHTVPRYNNPTGVFDNDQYVYCIYVKKSDGGTQGTLETVLGALATKAGIDFEQNIDA